MRISLRLPAIVFIALFAVGCGSKKIYDESEYYYNSTRVWEVFEYGENESFERAGIELREKLKPIWVRRIEKGNYTKESISGVEEIINHLVPADGMPDEINCAGKQARVALLLHGLYDSPYTMKDLGRFFNGQCYITRYLLLPGHGTVPGDLRALEYIDWVKAVSDVMDETRKDFPDATIAMAGFSTGAGLALNYVLNNPDSIDAVFLFAPLVELSGVRVFGSYVIEALLEYVDKHDERDTFKYESVTANSVIQANKLADTMRVKLRKSELKMPVFITQARHDYTLSAKDTIQLFDSGVFGSKSVFLLYSPHEVAGFERKNCESLSEDLFLNTNKASCDSSFFYETENTRAMIDDYSHMSLTLDASDRHYGIEQGYRYCLQYKSEAKQKACKADTWPRVCHGERAAFGGNYYSDECSRRKATMIRLTSNPGFEHLKKQLEFFMRRYGL